MVQSHHLHQHFRASEHQHFLHIHRVFYVYLVRYRYRIPLYCRVGSFDAIIALTSGPRRQNHFGPPLLDHHMHCT